MSVPAGDYLGQVLSGDGPLTAKPRGGSVSPLEKHADFLLGLIARRPDLTLDEAVLAMHRHKIPGSRSAMWRFFKHHNVTFKKKPSRRPARALVPSPTP